MTLALIAGRGDLPALVAAACLTPPVVCRYAGTQLIGLEPDLTFRLETLGSLFLELGKRGVTQVCFAGGLDRPALDPALVDAQTAPLVPVFLQALQKGDDAALRVLLDLIQHAGFAVLAAHEIAPDLLAREGPYGGILPDAAMHGDADIAAAFIRTVSEYDIGQACVVRAGQVIAMEDARGTDAMLARLEDGTGGILYKGAKVGQSREIDLPTVGPDTLKAAYEAGLSGVVVEAGATLVLHAARCRDIADRLGTAFWARAQP